jgi:polygalacturonase
LPGTDLGDAPAPPRGSWSWPENVRDHGAAGDGTTLDTAAIQRAIAAVAAVGGGTVHLPAGRYLTGSIVLESKVTLELAEGAVLLGSTDTAHYRRLNFLALVLADGKHDIAIRGRGTIDGQGRVFGAAHPLPATGGPLPDAHEASRPVLLNFRGCRNVRVEGVMLRDSGCWVQLYRDCQGVTVEDVTVRSIAALTNDGIDIDGCKRVVVRNCDIDSGDDGICLKSSRQFCEDVLVERCRVRSSCNALKFGTASHVGFRNITCRDLEIHDTYLSAIALEMVDGGTIENVTISKVSITTTSNALFVRLGHRTGPAPGTLKGVVISDVTAEIPDRPRREMNKFSGPWRHRCQTMLPASITGLPGHPVREIVLRDWTLVYGGAGDNAAAIPELAAIPEAADCYPECTMFGPLPAWALFCRHVERLTLERVAFRLTGRDARPALACDDVRRLALSDVRIEHPGRTASPILLNDVVEATIRAPAGDGLVEQRGETRDVTIDATVGR